MTEEMIWILAIAATVPASLALSLALVWAVEYRRQRRARRRLRRVAGQDDLAEAMREFIRRAKERP